MEIYQLRTFKMVAEEGHLTRAAGRLHASQPTVSAHIKALEDELGVSLFLRTPKGMTLTQAGSKLLEHVDRVLLAVDDISSHAGLLRGIVSGDVRIGINSEPESLRIGRIFSTMKNRHPDLQIHLLQTVSGEVPARLQDGRFDVGFIFGELDSEQVYTIELCRLPLVIAGPLEWRNDLEKASAGDLASFPWILTPEDCPFHTVSRDFFIEHDLCPAKVALSDQESTIKSMIRAGIGLALMLESETRENGVPVLSVWPGVRFSLPLSIACLKRRRNEQIIQTLFSVLSSVWSPEDEVVPATE